MCGVRCLTQPIPTPAVASAYRLAMLDGTPRKVLVTGAAGRTGSLVFKSLQSKTGKRRAASASGT